MGMESLCVRWISWSENKDICSRIQHFAFTKYAPYLLSYSFLVLHPEIICPGEVRTTSVANKVGHYIITKYNLHEPEYNLNELEYNLHAPDITFMNQNITFMNPPVAKTPKGVMVGLWILHGLLTNKNIRIPINNKNLATPLPPKLWHILGEKGGKFKNCRRLPKFCMGS